MASTHEKTEKDGKFRAMKAGTGTKRQRALHNKRQKAAQRKFRVKGDQRGATNTFLHKMAK